MYFEELKVGITVDIPPAIITKSNMLKFAKVYDNILIHTDEEYAKNSCFKGLIAPGVMSFMSVWAKFIEVSFFKESFLAGTALQIEWKKPVYAGDVLSGIATLIDLKPRNEKNGLAYLEVKAYNQNKDLVLIGKVELVIKINLKNKNPA